MAHRDSFLIPKKVTKCKVLNKKKGQISVSLHKEATKKHFSQKKNC
uniref:Uncharacterized protein n=1 Tax=Anguilla anguilla TaxID=7936 RepID=A0A0E9RGB7_ANGAN